MTLKLTDGTRTEIIEVARITTEELANHGIEVQAFDHRGERTGRFIVLENPPYDHQQVREYGIFNRAYLMDGGKTFESIRQVNFDPVEDDNRKEAPSE